MIDKKELREVTKDLNSRLPLDQQDIYSSVERVGPRGEVKIVGRKRSKLGQVIPFSSKPVSGGAA